MALGRSTAFECEGMDRMRFPALKTTRGEGFSARRTNMVEYQISELSCDFVLRFQLEETWLKKRFSKRILRG